MSLAAESPILRSGAVMGPHRRAGHSGLRDWTSLQRRQQGLNCLLTLLLQRIAILFNHTP